MGSNLGQGSMCHSSQSRNALGDVVNNVVEFSGDFVEELVQRNKVRPPNIPVRLLSLPLQVDHVG